MAATDDSKLDKSKLCARSHKIATSCTTPSKKPVQPSEVNVHLESTAPRAKSKQRMNTYLMISEELLEKSDGIRADALM